MKDVKRGVYSSMAILVSLPHSLRTRSTLSQATASTFPEPGFGKLFEKKNKFLWDILSVRFTTLCKKPVLVLLQSMDQGKWNRVGNYPLWLPSSPQKLPPSSPVSKSCVSPSAQRLFLSFSSFILFWGMHAFDHFPSSVYPVLSLVYSPIIT